MKHRKTEKLGDVLRRCLRENGLETPLNEQRIIDAWGKVTGPMITSYTRGLYIKNQVLYVQLTSAPLRQELMMQRKRLTQALNHSVGAHVITDIVLR
jgi:predicted nucleic acid-binding Zn ribbon protein